MSIYDLILKRIREIQGKTEEEEPLTNISASSMLTAEITLISSILIALIMVRLINKALMIVFGNSCILYCINDYAYHAQTYKGAERFFQ